MAITNRDLDASEQLYTVDYINNALVATGATLYVGLVKSPGQLLAHQVSANGLSGTPAYNVEIHRWNSAGLTVIAPGSAVTVPIAFGVSGGALGVSYAANSSLAALQSGDLLVLKSSGANTAALQVVASFVIKAVQDYKKTFGV